MECTNVFLAKLSKQYANDVILLVCDGAAWHKSKALQCPENIQLLSIPPYTPEMNPIEQFGNRLVLWDSEMRYFIHLMMF